MPAERLHKLIAHAGLASRRAAEDWVRAGRVTVDGTVVTEVGAVADPMRQDIRVDGHPLPVPAPLVTLALHKPPRMVSTASDPQGRPTVVDLANRSGLATTGTRLYPVGRLDVLSEGLILVTNDGDLALRLTHPRYEHEKEYFVLVTGRPADRQLHALRRGGIEVEGRRVGPSIVERAAVRELPGGVDVDAAPWRPERDSWLRVVLREGRKRQIRVMCDAVGLSVIRLVRSRVGPVDLGDLAAGDARRLTDDEEAALMSTMIQNSRTTEPDHA
jgi:23S rRNA pseudouridine2605 synthase